MIDQSNGCPGLFCHAPRKRARRRTVGWSGRDVLSYSLVFDRLRDTVTHRPGSRNKDCLVVRNKDCLALSDKVDMDLQLLLSLETEPLRYPRGLPTASTKSIPFPEK